MTSKSKSRSLDTGKIVVRLNSTRTGKTARADNKKILGYAQNIKITSLAIFSNLMVMISIGLGSPAWGFCGFYVAKADTKLYNMASKVAIMRDGDRTVITMANDYRGELTEFAMVVPVPTILDEDQIHVTSNALIDHLDAYSAPRLVEYFDEDPCAAQAIALRQNKLPEAAIAFSEAVAEKAVDLGVTIEAEYTVGEYDILILSAEESDGLATWLTQNGYKMPQGAAAALDSYIKQGTKFFVAKVNLEEQADTGLEFLRPLQIAFESPNFMLPIRLGMINADGKQELFIFTLTRSGRVETTNYRTVKLPTDMDVPLYVKEDFSPFYKAMFERSVRQENEKAVFMEYAWDMNWCDPCAADPLSDNQLRELGVFWLDAETLSKGSETGPGPQLPIAPGQARDVFITRLHVSYDAQTFPEDLKFKTTEDRTNFQGRYVLRHPFTGEVTCTAGQAYRAGLPDRFEREAQTLARLTGWEIQEIRDRMAVSGQDAGARDPNAAPDNTEEVDSAPKTPWWRRIWRSDRKDKDE